MLSKEQLKCIWANEGFGVRVCNLECTPVSLEKCTNCAERTEGNAK